MAAGVCDRRVPSSCVGQPDRRVCASEGTLVRSVGDILAQTVPGGTGRTRRISTGQGRAADDRSAVCSLLART